VKCSPCGQSEQSEFVPVRNVQRRPACRSTVPSFP
jgi:hypothetical protein